MGPRRAGKARKAGPEKDQRKGQDCRRTGGAEPERGAGRQDGICVVCQCQTLSLSHASAQMFICQNVPHSSCLQTCISCLQGPLPVQTLLIFLFEILI